MKTVIIIPARLGSKRFPGKPLILIGGKPLIQRVWEQACGSRRAERVIVATDDKRIRDTVRAAGGEVIMTEGPYRTGTDRLAWVADRLPADLYINLQGDELIQDARILDELIASFTAAQPLGMGTLRTRIRNIEENEDPNVVKVVIDTEGFALYFSRSPIPYPRDAVPAERGSRFPRYKHLGIYIYRRDTLKKLSGLPSGFLEEQEKLEQLRALENGIRIKVWETTYESLRIDTREDVQQAESVLVKSGTKTTVTGSK